MDLKKSISVSKFLLPLSVAIMTVGFILLFLIFFSILDFGSNFGYVLYGIIPIVVLLGVSLFIASLIDQSISRKRNTNNIEAQDTSLSSNGSSLVKIGFMIIMLIVGLVVFAIIVLSNIDVSG